MELPRIPRETGSALFAAEVTYTGSMEMLFGMTDEAIRRKQSLRGVLRDLPLLNALITPVLSPRIVMRQSLKPQWTSMRTASSSAIDSAQPMSLPPPFHPFLSFQAAHRVPMTTPMPQFIDASTHMSGSTVGLGVSEQAVQGVLSIACHQRRHSRTGAGKWRHMYSLRNLDRKHDRGGRKARPSR